MSRSLSYRSTGLALALSAVAAAALPVLASAEEWEGGWNDESQQLPPGDEAYPAQPAPVDVTADLAAPGAAVTLETFREGLAPYGEWMSSPAYGRVWRPLRIAPGWRPYYYGRWEWTDEGWLWVSDEPWGWAAYHYGRWAYDGAYGWLWVPGYQWAPAWVSWRSSPDYIGWAPLAPGFSVYVTSYPVHYGWWNFVPCRRFVGYPVNGWASTGEDARGIFHATRPAPPRSASYGSPAPAWGGPARPLVERSVGHAIAPVRLQPVGSPAAMPGVRAAGVVPVYRPELRPASPAPAPARSGLPGAAAVAPARPMGQGQVLGQAPQPAPRPAFESSPGRPAPFQQAPQASPGAGRVINPGSAEPLQGPRPMAVPPSPQRPSGPSSAPAPAPAPVNPRTSFARPSPQQGGGPRTVAQRPQAAAPQAYAQQGGGPRAFAQRPQASSPQVYAQHAPSPRVSAPREASADRFRSR